jgi:DNA-nicking Smr family endonuclease
MADADPPPHDVPIDAELDLHAFAPRDATDVVDAYLEAARERGLTEVRIVHGRGRGVQRAAVQRLLAAHPLVVAFGDDSRSHLGATLVRLTPLRSTP